MAGGLTISTLNDSSGVLATQNGMSGICKSWVNFNGVSGTVIRGSFNVSSVTRNAAGDYTISFTTSMPDANYSVTAASSPLYGVVDAFVDIFDSASGESAPTTSSYRVTGRRNDVSGLTDLKYICLATFR